MRTTLKSPIRMMFTPVSHVHSNYVCEPAAAPSYLKAWQKPMAHAHAGTGQYLLSTRSFCACLKHAEPVGLGECIL